MRGLVRATGAALGLRVSEADSASRARAELAKGAPDLILIDLLMEKVNGLEFMGELQRDPERRRIPIVVMTDSQWDEQTRARLGGRATRILRKGTTSRNDTFAELRSMMAARLQAGEDTDG